MEKIPTGLITVVLFVVLINIAKHALTRVKINKYTKKQDDLDNVKSLSPNIIKPVDLIWLTLPSALLSLVVLVAALVLDHLFPATNNFRRHIGQFMSFLILGGGSVYLFLYSLYCMLWEVKIEGKKLMHRTMYGQKKYYNFTDITKCVSNHADKWYIYSNDKRIFTLNSSMNIEVFKEKMEQFNVPVIDKNRMSLDQHTIRPYIFMPLLHCGGCIIFAFLFFVSICQKEKIMFTLGFLAVVVVFLIALLVAIFDKTNIYNKEIYQKAFMKKTKKFFFDEISYAKNEKGKLGTEYIVMYGKAGKLMRIREHNNGVLLFEEKMKAEGITWRK